MCTTRHQAAVLHFGTAALATHARPRVPLLLEDRSALPAARLVGSLARWRRSSASSSFECIAPISSRNGSMPAATISIARSTSTSPAEPVKQRPHLLVDQRLERLAVAQRVVHGEPQRLLVAAGAEAGDRLDDLHVVRS